MRKLVLQLLSKEKLRCMMLSMPPFVSWYFKAHEQLRVFIPEKKGFVISRKTKLKKIFINNDSALSTGYAMKVIQRVYCNDFYSNQFTQMEGSHLNYQLHLCSFLCVCMTYRRILPKKRPAATCMIFSQHSFECI